MQGFITVVIFNKAVCHISQCPGRARARAFELQSSSCHILQLVRIAQSSVKARLSVTGLVVAPVASPLLGS